MNLSPHFTLDEMTFSQTAKRKGIDNTPSEAAIENLKRTCDMLERVRAIYHKPLSVSSGFRCLTLNRAIGSKDSSQHVKGCAADFKVIGVPLASVMEAIIVNELPFDQLIYEHSAWIHISVANFPWTKPRGETLTIDSKGVRPWHSQS